MQNWTKKFHDKNLFNTSILESDNFKVIPSVGALMEGWLLLIPKEHCISLSYLEKSFTDELERLSNEVISLLRESYDKEVLIFENGAVSNNSSIGCGVDYAHMHFVPFEFDARELINDSYDMEIEWNSIGHFKDLVDQDKSSPYFYIQNSQERMYANVPNSVSQLIRKGIAKELGIEDQFDWKHYSFEGNVRKTIIELGHGKFINCTYVNSK